MKKSAIYSLLDKLCHGKFPLEIYFNYKDKSLSYKSMFLTVVFDVVNYLAIDYLDPTVGNNFISSHQEVMIAFGRGIDRYKFTTRVIRKDEKNKLIMLVLPKNIENFERRKYARTGFPNNQPYKFLFNFQEGHPSWKENKYEGRLLNIAQGGLAFSSEFIRLDKFIKIEDVLKITFDQPQNKKLTSLYTVEVIHVQVANFSGCQFLNKDQITKHPFLLEGVQVEREKRKYFRLIIPKGDRIPIKMTISGQQHCQGTLKDISVGGIAVHNLLDEDQIEALKIGDTIFINFKLFNHIDISTEASVRQKQKTFLGLEFKELKMHEFDAISKFIRNNWARYRNKNN